MRRPWLFESGFFLTLWLVVLAAVPAKLFQDPGTFWHTQIGLTILQTGQLPETDTFTYTKSGEPWVCQYWLCDLGMAALYRIGGWDSLLVFTVTLLAGTFAWLAGRLYRAGLDGVVAVLLAFLALAASAPQFHVRPLIFTIYLMALEVVLLADVESGRRPLRHLWWFVPMFVLWTNVHGGVIGGLASLALVSGGWIVAGLLKLDSPLRTLRDGLHLTAIAGVCGLTILVNPYGLRLPLLWLEILRLPLSEFVTEHAAITHSPTTAVVAIVLLAVYLLFLLSTKPKEIRATWLLPLVWFALACQRNRHAAIYAVVVLAVLPDVLPRCAFRRLLEWRELYFPPAADAPPGRWWPRWVMLGALLAVALGLQSSGVRALLIGTGWAQLDADYWPVQLLPQLREMESSTAPVRIFNDDLYGGFLIFHTPKLPVYLDDRCELFGEEFLRRYVAMGLSDSKVFEQEDAERHFTHALVKRGTAVEQLLRKDANWKLLGETPGAALFGKK